MNASLPQRLPKFRVHKATLQAYVELSGQRFYLGYHESAEARQKYNTLVAEWLANGRQLRASPDQITVKELIARYWVYGERYYRNADGTVARELHNIVNALRPVKELYGAQPAAQFGPRALRAVREKMIQDGLRRRNINCRIGRIKRVFKWAASEELIPGEVYHALLAVDGLRYGRCAAKESDPVRPVPQALFRKRQDDAMVRQMWHHFWPGEARRRTKVISTLPDERAGLSLVHAVLVDVSRRWRGIRISPADLETLNALRAELVPLATSA